MQGYYDDAASLGEKYDMINARGLAGTGMWTLLMDQGDNALWNVLVAKFVTDMTPATYVPLAPARVLDSRFGNGLSGKFSAGVPANATAVTGNLTVTNQTAAGAAFLGPSPTPAPSSSTLNFPVGDNRANGVTLALGAGGTLSATYLASSGSTDFVFDVTGYFVP